MKIIKKGNPYRKHKCSMCKTIFAYLVHRLVATAFIPNPYNYNEVNHISGIKSCNCSKNLEWCNRSMNMIHAYKMGLCHKKKA